CPGSWSIAFLTGTPADSVAEHLEGEHVTVYVPTTPNPTSGYVVMLPKSRVHELDMTVDEALKYVISMGVVARRAAPNPPSTAAPPPAVPAKAGAVAPSVADTRN